MQEWSVYRDPKPDHWIVVDVDSAVAGPDSDAGPEAAYGPDAVPGRAVEPHPGGSSGQ